MHTKPIHCPGTCAGGCIILNGLWEQSGGSNRGVLAPTTIRELHDWLQAETQFWSRVAKISAGNRRNAIDAGVQCLQNAMTHVQNAMRCEGSTSAVKEQLNWSGSISTLLQSDEC